MQVAAGDIEQTVFCLWLFWALLSWRVNWWWIVKVFIIKTVRIWGLNVSSNIYCLCMWRPVYGIGWACCVKACVADLIKVKHQHLNLHYCWGTDRHSILFIRRKKKRSFCMHDELATFCNNFHPDVRECLTKYIFLLWLGTGAVFSAHPSFCLQTMIHMASYNSMLIILWTLHHKHSQVSKGREPTYSKQFMLAITVEVLRLLWTMTSF